MSDEDLKVKFGEPSIIDKVIMDNRKKPLTSEELKGFGKRKPKVPNIGPHIKFSMPSDEDEPKGYTIEVGVRGKF